MYLTKDEEAILLGEQGETRQQLMEILVAVGTVFGAEKMVPICSAQISGASYKTIGSWGLSWLSNLDATATVPAVLNPIGMDRIRYRELLISDDFAEKQLAVVSAYERLGIQLACTCTPYYIRETRYGEHLAWSESSAVSYANSVIGARTNREGGPSALAAAIIGKTPAYGLHCEENRIPELTISIENAPESVDQAWYGALGFLAGKEAGAKIPLFTGIIPADDELKGLGAAMAATGAVALYHVAGVTPEARRHAYSTKGTDIITIDAKDVFAVFTDADIDAVAIGCPHCSVRELQNLASLLKGKEVIKPFYIFAARAVIESVQPLVRQIEESGALVFADTCMVVSPAMERFDRIMVNSGKALSYIPNMCGAAARIGTLPECVQEATKRE